MSFSGAKGGTKQSSTQPSPKLRKVIRQLMQDPSKFFEIAEKLRRENRELLAELAQWLHSRR